MKKLFAPFALILLTACATVSRGTSEDVVINYSPKDAKVTTTLNHKCSNSPCVVKVPRKEAFTVTASKSGYETKSVHVSTQVSKKGAAGLAGNLLLGGVIGAGVDVATGAARDHTPNPVEIHLNPVGQNETNNQSPNSKTETSVPTS
ncbi:MAG: translation initiation factor 2 [Hyphomicrobiales bacterium]|nr:MAG: translation initiation factor 2 [Hyphomicrobiales bacterium]